MTQTQQHNVPALRFPEFNGEWDSLKLSDIATFSKGKGISKADIDEDGVLECIRYGQLYTDYSETIKSVKSRTSIPAKDLVLSDANDIIIPASGETQIDIATASCVLKGGVALGGDLNIVRTEHNGVFLSYYLNSTRKYDIARLSQGISVVHLYATQLKTLHLSLPEANEQKKIASFLSSVDRKIAQLGQKKALLQQYKRGCMQKLFSQELRFKDAQGNDFPDWEEKQLESVATIIMGTSPKSEFYNYKSEGLPLIQGNADIKNRKSAPRIYTSVVTKECLPEDILLSVRAPVGEVSISEHHACIGRGISAIRANQSNHQAYVFQFLLWFEQRWASFSQGSTFEAVNTKDIKLLSISAPSKLEQQKIANFLSSIDRKIDLVATELDHAKTFKKGLLQQMFI